MTPTPSVTLHAAPEMTFVQAAEPANGPVVVPGLYGRYGPGDRSLETCRVSSTAMTCARYRADLGEDGPRLVQATGQAAHGSLAVDRWQPLAVDTAASQAVAQAALAQTAAAVAAVDWSALARPNYVEATAAFRWDAGAVAATPLELRGYDTASNRVIWRGQGPNLPTAVAIVTRFPVLYVLAGADSSEPVDIVATIEGYVEE